jgi:hypothetical protein
VILLRKALFHRRGEDPQPLERRRAPGSGPRGGRALDRSGRGRVLHEEGRRLAVERIVGRSGLRESLAGRVAKSSPENPAFHLPALIIRQKCGLLALCRFPSPSPDFSVSPRCFC